MAAPPASDVAEGPVLSLVTKRLRALRKKYNRILQMEDSVAQGKPLNKEQEDVLRSKPSVSAAIDELEKLRLPLAAAVADEIRLASSAAPSLTAATDDDDEEKQQNVAEIEPKVDRNHSVLEDLLNLLYFGTMFDVRNQNEFTSTILTRTHERGCCLTYDYVTDDETNDLLGESDLDLISMLGGLLVSRPVDSSLSHKNALQLCVERAKQWLANSDQPVDSDSNVTYAALRMKLNKIMASDYFTTTPEMKATVEMAAAAAGNYTSFQVPLNGSVVAESVPVQVDGQFQQKDEDATYFQGNGTYDNQSSPVEEPQQGEFESEVPTESEPDNPLTEEKNHRDEESKEQHYVSRRNYQNQRGGRGGGGRRGYPNGRGARESSRGGGPYQNGRYQYYDQSANYYPRNYNNNRGRGGGGNFYNDHNSGAQASHAPADS
ncbi:glycine-rich protein [Actinidia rufa]|uniref:Glycine-rich protein n=1 Tax=Actinidia rufa TaxID=165716 RepID=A0A7J0FPM4_9ERIC|nr:glycine-rich protein [Actinidia rufa]